MFKNLTDEELTRFHLSLSSPTSAVTVYSDLVTKYNLCLSYNDFERMFYIEVGRRYFNLISDTAKLKDIKIKSQTGYHCVDVEKFPLGHFVYESGILSLKLQISKSNNKGIKIGLTESIEILEVKSSGVTLHINGFTKVYSYTKTLKGIAFDILRYLKLQDATSVYHMIATYKDGSITFEF